MRCFKFLLYKMGVFLRKVSKKQSNIKMKIEKFTTVKDQTTGTKVRTIPKRKRSSLRDQNEKNRTKSLEGLEGTPNITANEIKHQLRSIKMGFHIEDAKENGEKIISGVGSCLDDIDAIIKKCQELRKISK